MRRTSPFLLVVSCLLYHVIMVDSKVALSDLVDKNIRPIAMTSIPEDRKFLLNNRFSSHIPVHATLPNMQETVYQQVYELPQTLPGQPEMFQQSPNFQKIMQTSKQDMKMILPSNPMPPLLPQMPPPLPKMPPPIQHMPPPIPQMPPPIPQSQSSPTQVHNNFFIKSSSDMSGVQKAGATGSSDARSSSQSSPVQTQGGLRALLESTGSGFTGAPATGMQGGTGVGIGGGGGGGGGAGGGVSGSFPIGGFGGKFPGVVPRNGAGNGISFGGGGGGGAGGSGSNVFTGFPGGFGSGVTVGGGGGGGAGGGVTFPIGFSGGKRWGRNGRNTGFIGGKLGFNMNGYTPKGFMLGGGAQGLTNQWNIGRGGGMSDGGVYYLNNGMYTGYGRDIGYDGWQTYSGRFGTGGHDRFIGGGFGITRGPFTSNMQNAGFGINNGFRGNGQFIGMGMNGGFPNWSASSSTAFNKGSTGGFQAGSGGTQMTGGNQGNTGIFNSNNILTNLLTYNALSQMLGAEQAEGKSGGNALILKALLGGSRGGGFGSSGMGGGSGSGGFGSSFGGGSSGGSGGSGSPGSWSSVMGGSGSSAFGSGGWSFGRRHGTSGSGGGSFSSGGWNASAYSGDNDDDDRK